VKVARPVWARGKGGDNFKALPMGIYAIRTSENKGESIMNYSNEDLMKIINRKPLGDFCPYIDWLEEQDNMFFNDFIEELKSCELIEMDVNYTQGCGYASYIDIFCYKSDGSSTVIKKYGKSIDGITIYLCKLAPVAVFGSGHMGKSDRGSSYYTLDKDGVGSLPEGEWSDVLSVIKQKLKKYGIQVLGKHYISKPLGFKTKIHTIFAEEDNYKIFDAFFYFED
jgi:hypothetical protein